MTPHTFRQQLPFIGILLPSPEINGKRLWKQIIISAVTLLSQKPEAFLLGGGNHQNPGKYRYDVNTCPDLVFLVPMFVLWFLVV